MLQERQISKEDQQEIIRLISQRLGVKVPKNLLLKEWKELVKCYIPLIPKIYELVGVRCWPAPQSCKRILEERLQRFDKKVLQQLLDCLISNEQK